MTSTIVRPMKTLEFDFAPTLARDTAGAPYLFVGETTGNIAVLDAAFNVVCAFSLSFPPGSSCSVNPGRGCFSALRKGELISIVDFHGEEKHSLSGNYLCAAYNGDELWALERAGPEQVRWRVFDAELAPVAELVLEDPLPDSVVSLTGIPNCSDMVLELAAGQDGSALYLLSGSAGALAVAEMFPGECFSAPVYRRDGTRFLTFDFYEQILYHYTFPALQPLGTFSLGAWAQREIAQAAEYGDCLYLDEKTAAVSLDNRYFRLDLAAMEVTDEIVVAGHEPRPAEQFYPLLAGDKSLVTDIRSVAVAGDQLFCHFDSANKNAVLVLARSDFVKPKLDRNTNGGASSRRCITDWCFDEQTNRQNC
jgi:hypothetical protein